MILVDPNQESRIKNRESRIKNREGSPAVKVWSSRAHGMFPIDGTTTIGAPEPGAPIARTPAVLAEGLEAEAGVHQPLLIVSLKRRQLELGVEVVHASLPARATDGHLEVPSPHDPH